MAVVLFWLIKLGIYGSQILSWKKDVAKSEARKRKVLELEKSRDIELSRLEEEGKTAECRFDETEGKKAQESIARLRSRHEALQAAFAQIEPIVKAWRCLAAR